jgi:hypothetical protein
VYCSRDWKILSDLLDQKVHRERSGQTPFIILVSERQVDHGAVTFVEPISSDMLAVIEWALQQFIKFWWQPIRKGKSVCKIRSVIASGTEGTGRNLYRIGGSSWSSDRYKVELSTIFRFQIQSRELSKQKERKEATQIGGITSLEAQTDRSIRVPCFFRLADRPREKKSNSDRRRASGRRRFVPVRARAPAPGISVREFVFLRASVFSICFRNRHVCGRWSALGSLVVAVKKK